MFLANTKKGEFFRYILIKNKIQPYSKKIQVI